MTPRWMNHATVSSTIKVGNSAPSTKNAAAQRERAMPQPHQPFSYIPPAYITPIICPYCGGSAPIVRRTPHPAVKGELRTFECRECLKQTEMTVKD